MSRFINSLWYTTGTRGDLLALLAGASLPLAFAPFHLFPIAILAPALLFLVWLDATPRSAFRRGWLFGAGMFGVGISWIYVAIHDFGHSNIFTAVLLTGGFVAFLALFPAVLGYLVTRVFPAQNKSSSALKLLLVFPAAWTLFEWVRSWILTGFPWLNIGNSQIDAPLAGLAPLLGVYGMSLATAFSAALLVRLLLAEKSARLRPLFTFVILWSIAGLLVHIEWTQPLGKPLQVALIQGNIPQDVKWRPEQQQRTLELYIDLTRRHWGSDIILWPEAALPTFYHEVADNYLARLQSDARTHGTDLLIGLPVLDQTTGRYYNSVMSLGSSQGFYHKQHLVPFGDYVPLQNWLRGLIGFFDLPMSGFSPGLRDQRLLQVAGHKVGISICYEDVFGEEVIHNLPEASLLVNATNNAWYGDSLAPPQHLQMSRLRALETGRPVLRVTTNGISAIIDPKGEIVTRSPQFKTYVITGTVQPMQGTTPYVRFGNAPVLLLLALMMGAGYLLNRR
ncbi:MAG: apolipoprotein N-acyltransferase [Gammaproteobacteria bacterium]